EAGHLVPVDHPGVAPPPAPVDRDLGDLPLGGLGLGDGHVVDGHLLAVDRHGQVEHLGDHQRLGGPLLEPADVELAREDHRARLDAPYAGDGQEHAAARADLDHHAVHARRAGAAQPDHHVPDAADLVSRRVEDRRAGQTGDEDLHVNQANSAKTLRRGPRTCQYPTGITVITSTGVRVRYAGLAMAFASSLCFAFSGPMAKYLNEAGVAPLEAVWVRMAGAGLLLLGVLAGVKPAALRIARSRLPFFAVYAVVAVAGVQSLYFAAITRLPVGVALLLEFMAPVMVVAYVRIVRKIRLA